MTLSRSPRLAFLGRALMLGALCQWGAACTKKTPAAAGSAAGEPPEVAVLAVKQEDVPIYNEYVGSLEGSVNAKIQARVQGYLTKQNYKEGTQVKKGDLLFEIDARPFEAALAKAKAALQEAEASSKNQELTAERSVELYKRKVISTQERDTAVQAAAGGRAQVQAQQAQVQQAELDLDYTKIISPIHGIVGIARAQVGDLVGPSTGVLTTVSTVDPMRAYFSVSEQRYVQYQRQYSDVTAREQHQRELQFELILADGSVYPRKGEFFATEREVDPTTGAFRIAAQFPNPDAFLRPGQFARVRVRSDVRRGVVLVPQRAVTELQGINQVAVIGTDNKASIRPVTVGERIDTNWIIESGLKAGERIGVEGTQKVRDGAPVVAKAWTPPAATPAPGTPGGDAPQIAKDGKPGGGAGTPSR
jgi:membrane fusion protein (multidrug efflux system)